MCLGSIIHIAMKSDKETVETLVKFDDFLDVVLGDITEFGIPLEGKRITRWHQILLSTRNTAMLVPGEGPDTQKDFLDLW